MHVESLERKIRLTRPLDEVFAFFADARNLGALTPPWLSFKIATPGEIDMAPGTRIDYLLRVHGLPLRWQSEITVWEPPRRFVDVQVKGPYRLWEHEHTFEAVAGNETRVTDRVRFAVPGGRLVSSLLVRRDVEKIFAYRSQRLAELFPSEETS